ALAQPAVATLPGPPINRGPAPQSGLVDPQLPGHLRDRLTRLPHDPHRTGPELLIKLSPRLGHLRPPRLETPPRYEGKPRAHFTTKASRCQLVLARVSPTRVLVAGLVCL